MQEKFADSLNFFDETMETTVAHRLKEAREALGLSQRAFVKPLDLNSATVSVWENGKSGMSSGSALLIERVHNISAKWLLSGVGDMFIRPTMDITVPVLRAYHCTGTGARLVDYLTGEGMSFDVGFLNGCFSNSKPENLYVLRVDDDSMEPTIKKNELIFIDNAVPEWLHNGVWVFGYCGFLTVRRIQTTAHGDYIAKCDNPRYEPMELGPYASALGRVVGVAPRAI
jgi:DNA-binding transcriptional regulator YiaG